MTTQNPLWIIDAGRIAYGPAFDLQRQIVAARKSGAVPDVLLFCEHPHVITLGRNGQRENLLANANILKQMNVEFHETDRGGDITYHGPGQVVGYPILDLTQHKRDVRWYVEQLEEVMIRTAADYGLAARRILCRHGIWIDAPSENGAAGAASNAGVGIDLNADSGCDLKVAVGAAFKPAPTVEGPTSGNPRAESFLPSGTGTDSKGEERANESQQTSAIGAAQLSPARKGWVGRQETASAVGATQACETRSSPGFGNEEKLAALGVHLSRWVTSHGFAFNVSTDLRYFDLIIPCGLKDKRATSLERALGRAVSLDEASNRLGHHFVEIFHAEHRHIPLDYLRAAIKV